ncbi:porin [Marinomonas rhizomae]|uniref:porin n=1 Tax=Marinomonas rhizomae TaxID=491948 RepID=UPI00210404AC|nr:porin [Marinomonas rhizomae]UTV99781.1 porin [Marinomonas rhizomae]
MKQTILVTAMLSSLTTTSVMAATIVDQDGFKYKLNGDIQIQLQKDNGEDKNLYVNFDSLKLDNKISYQLTKDLSAFGRIKFDFDDAANDDEDQNSAALKDAYVGFAYRDTALSVGKQDYATDEFGVAEDYEMDSDDVAFDETGGDDVILVNFDLDKVNLMLSTELRAEGEDSEDEQSFDAFASFNVSDVEFAVAYQNREVAIHGDKMDSYGVSAKYDAGFATFAADYSEAKDTLKVYNLVTMFDVADSTTMVLGYVNNKPESDEEVREWYTNVTYAFPEFKDVKVFAELSNTNKEGAEMAYVAGTEIEF